VEVRFYRPRLTTGNLYFFFSRLGLLISVFSLYLSIYSNSNEPVTRKYKVTMKFKLPSSGVKPRIIPRDAKGKLVLIVICDVILIDFICQKDELISPK
jgi:hypothetical protein